MKVIASVKRTESSSSENAKLFEIEPYYEICENGTYRKIVNKSIEIPNKGKTFFINKNVDGNGISKQMSKATDILQKYNEKLIKVEVDTDKVLQNYEENNINSCKYGINMYSVNELKSNDIIEIIKNDEVNSIDEIIEQNSKRYIEIDNIPLNNKILLEIGDYIYGCFDYSVAERKSELDNITQKRIIISACYNSNPTNSINKYKKEDIQPLIKTVSIGYTERRFIADKNELNDIKKMDTLDFIDDKSLVNLCQHIMKENKKHNITNQNIKLIKECVEEIDNNRLLFKDSKLKRLQMIQKEISDNEELRKNIVNTFFELGNWSQLAEKYLDENPSQIIKIAEKTEKYKEKIKQLNLKNEELKKLKEDIKELKDKKKEFSKIAIKNEENKINKLKKEYENLENKYNNYKSELEILKKSLEEYKSLNEIQGEVKYKERRKKELEEQIKELEKQFKDINQYPREAISKCLKDEMTKDIFRELIFSKNKTNKDENEKIDKPQVQKYKDADKIINIFKEKFEKAGRDYSEEDIINLIISITQNFITVFAGQPGVGKTSLCEILAKCFGVYENRFAKIPVERGWTSSKDLIGYYNPITKTIEKTNEDMFNCLSIVDYENKKKENNLYITLLDEANLSPIEHYWSNFMMLTDDYSSNTINIGGENEFRLTSATRFLATINYDHTTENLSDRFLDRAWVILMESSDIESMLNSSVGRDINNLEALIDFEDLNRFFGKRKGELKPHIRNQLTEILKVLRNNNINISKRSIDAVANYCIVAQMYMSDENDSYLPLDYAISQKILPMLKGQDDNFKNMLEKLKKVFDDAGLNKCKDIIEKMLRIGIEEYGYYQFFAG